MDEELKALIDNQGHKVIVKLPYRQFSSLVWDILGDGEKNGSFFGGSMAEATEDAIALCYAIIFEGVKSFADYEATLE